MPRRAVISLCLSLLLLLAALGGAGQTAMARPMPASAGQTCPCQPDSPCQCPSDAPCQVSQDLPEAGPPMLVSSLEWPQAPGLAAWASALTLPGLGSQVEGCAAPAAPPPLDLYLRHSSLLI